MAAMGRVTRLRARHVVGAAIVLFWLAVMAVLVGREVRARRAEVRRSAVATPSSADTWLGIFVSPDKPVGTLHIVGRPERREGVAGATLHVDGRLAVRMLGTPADMELAGWLWRAAEQPRAEFDATFASEGHEIRIRGRALDDALHARIDSGGTSVPVTLPIDRAWLAATNDVLHFPAPPLKVGESTTIEGFDPLGGESGEVRLTCLREEVLNVGGRTQRARVLSVTTAHGTVTVWAAGAGEVLKAETPWGITLQRLSRAEALALRARSDAPDLLTMLQVRPSGVRPPEGAHRMVIRLEGLPGDRPPPTDATQRLDADGRTLVISAPEAPFSPPAVRPAASSLAAALACDPLVACDNPKIRARAAAIVGDERDSWRRAVRIERWVDANLVKRPVLSIPSALDVLARREGDCTEHTVLFTALARAAGIPTRQIAGLAWSEDLEAFGYHAWPEVFVDGRWVWTDPTFGEAIADATHVRLTPPGASGFEDALDGLGRLRIEVVEAR
jgi:transglutaminase-like putative cysteine protease